VGGVGGPPHHQGPIVEVTIQEDHVSLSVTHEVTNHDTHSGCVLQSRPSSIQLRKCHKWATNTGREKRWSSTFFHYPRQASRTTFSLRPHVSRHVCPPSPVPDTRNACQECSVLDNTTGMTVVAISWTNMFVMPLPPDGACEQCLPGPWKFDVLRPGIAWMVWVIPPPIPSADILRIPGTLVPGMSDVFRSEHLY